MITGLSVAHAQTVIHVSPKGDDGTCDGSRAKKCLFHRSRGPFRTVQRARDEIRSLRDAGKQPKGGFVVEMEPGIYSVPGVLELNEKDAGTADAPIVYRASKRGAAILNGGLLLSGWRLVADPAVEKRIDPKARGKVYCIELTADQLDPIPGFANGGCGYRGKPEYPVGLYQAGKRLPISRWPNDGYTKMGECLGHSELHGHTGIAFTEGWFKYENERLNRWAGEPDLWFDGLWFHHWADQKMALETVDLKEKTIRLKNGKSHGFGFRKGHEFFVFNAVSEIDRPGEWAVDRTSRRIYLWPEEDLKAEPVAVSLHPALVFAQKIAHVKFDGLVFENCLKTAMVIDDSHNVVVSGCTLRHTGSWGIDINGGSDCTVVGCDLYDLGEGGVKVSGGVRNTLTPGNHLVEK